ncbi:MAG: phosphatidylglycerophosphatase A [Coxiella endosymbiont of Haemaphysalis qinghaiensis]
MSIFGKKNNVPQSIWANPIEFIACGFGVGAIPCIPGTCGTMLGVLFYLFLSQFSLLTYSIIALVLFIFGVIICDITNRHFGTFDHPAIVWDEIVGFLFVMITIPKIWYFILTGFILFRIFDIWKPWPINWLEKNIGGGFGVMIDDIMAVLYAWVILIIIVKVLNTYL